MKKNLLSVLFIAAVAAGCSSSSSRERRVSATDNTYQSPTYDRVVTESQIYSPASQDIAAAVSKSESTVVAGDSDRRLETQVRTALEENATLSGQVPNMHISVHGGKVMLQGSVGSEQEKQQAESIAQGIGGVASVENQLVVSATTSTAPSATSSSPESRIYAGTNVSSTDINAPRAAESSKTESSVSVSGQQTIEANKPETRTEVAAEVSSSNTEANAPAQAENSVTTPDLTPTSDRPGSRIYSTNAQDSANQPTAALDATTASTQSALVTQIRTAIGGDATLSAALPNITITEDGGKVTLKGKAKSEQEKKDIEALVQKTTGVTSVDNQLEISTSP